MSLWVIGKGTGRAEEQNHFLVFHFVWIFVCGNCPLQITHSLTYPVPSSERQATCKNRAWHEKEGDFLCSVDSERTHTFLPLPKGKGTLPLLYIDIHKAESTSLMHYSTQVNCVIYLEARLNEWQIIFSPSCFSKPAFASFIKHKKEEFWRLCWFLFYMYC